MSDQELLPLTLHNYLTLARKMLWVVHEELASKEPCAGGTMPQRVLGTCIADLSLLRQSIPDEAPAETGLPPGDDLRKLARLILAQHGESMIRLGHCAFSV